VLLAFLAAPDAHALPARDIAGIALHPWQLQTAHVRERMFAGAAATGVRWVRVDMPWSAVEGDGPTLQAGHGNWGTIDAIVHAADRHGLKLLPVVGFTPKWASFTGHPWTFPYAQPFEEFFAAALRRYPQIPAWELWNEPNFERFAKPQPDPAGFVEFLRSARRARDSVGSSAKLISGGVAPGGGIDIVPWVDQVAAGGGLGLIDGLGVHPYSVAEPDDPRAWMMQLEALHQHLAELGRPDLPLWLTEFGTPSVPVANGYGPPLTEQQQADRLRIAFAVAARFDWIENLTWYELREQLRTSAGPGVQLRTGPRRPVSEAGLRRAPRRDRWRLRQAASAADPQREDRAGTRAGGRPGEAAHPESNHHQRQAHPARQPAAVRRDHRVAAQARRPTAGRTGRREGGNVLGSIRGPRPAGRNTPGPISRLGRLPAAHHPGSGGSAAQLA